MIGSSKPTRRNWFPDFGNLTIQSTELTFNESYGGGSIAVWDDEHVEIQGCTIADNTARNSGGGLYASNRSVVAIRDSDFMRNESTNRGGVLYIQNRTDLLIEYCNFTDNRSSSDGGCMLIQNDVNADNYEWNIFGE